MGRDEASIVPRTDRDGHLRTAAAVHRAAYPTTARLPLASRRGSVSVATEAAVHHLYAGRRRRLERSLRTHPTPVTRCLRLLPQHHDVDDPEPQTAPVAGQ